MIAPENKEIQHVLARLQELSSGLYFISESESAFEIVHLSVTSANMDTTTLILQWLEVPADAKVETEELDYFLRNHTATDAEDPEVAHRFRELQAFLQQHLQDVQVYRIGERRITAVLLGRTTTGDYIGLRTTVIET